MPSVRPPGTAGTAPLQKIGPGSGSAESVLSADSVTLGGEEVRRPPKASMLRRLLGKVTPERQWTVLFYAQGNCDLEAQEWFKVQALRDVQSSREVELVSQVSSGSEGGRAWRLHSAYGDWAGVNPRLETDGVVEQANMGSAKTLEDFLKWGMKAYPSKHYMVVLGGHGEGHRGALHDDLSGDRLTPPELAEVLRHVRQDTGKKVDVLVADACLMGNAETAYELKDEVGYYIGTEEIATTCSLDYRKWGREMKRRAKKEELEAREVVEIVMNAVDPDHTWTFSAIDLSRMGPFGEAVAELARALEETSVAPEVLREVARGTEHYYKDEVGGEPVRSPVGRRFQQYRDIYHFAERLAADPRVEDPKLREAAEAVRRSVEAAVVENYVAPGGLYANSHGLSIHLSIDPALGPGKGYEELSLVRDTGWSGKVGNPPDASP